MTKIARSAKVSDENSTIQSRSRIRIYSISQRHGFVPKCHGSVTLVVANFHAMFSNILLWIYGNCWVFILHSGLSYPKNIFPWLGINFYKVFSSASWYSPCTGWIFCTFLARFVSLFFVVFAPLFFLVLNQKQSQVLLYTVKKLAVFLSPAGMSLTKLSLAGNY